VNPNIQKTYPLRDTEGSENQQKGAVLGSDPVMEKIQNFSMK